jgi:hypothetical protein
MMRRLDRVKVDRYLMWQIVAQESVVEVPDEPLNGSLHVQVVPF